MKYKIVLLICLWFMSAALFAQKTATLIYVDQYKDIAIKEMKRTGIPASITLAQGIVESNSGESSLAKSFNNHFGIKCKLDWKGATTFQDDDTKQECFRVYPDALSSFKDHSNFLKNRPNYASLFLLDPLDDSAWAYGLKKAGYATAPDYPKKLLKIIDDFELSQYNFSELNDEADTIATKAPTLMVPNKDSITKINPIANATILKRDSTSNFNTIDKKNNGNYNSDSSNSTPIDSTKNNHLNTIQSIDTFTLSNVKGINANSTTTGSIPTKMNSIQIDTSSMYSNTLKKDTAKTATSPIVVSTISPSTIHTKSYPAGIFKINQTPVIWAKAGNSFLQIATENKIPLYKIFIYNDLAEADLLEKDQLLFLAAKKKEGDKTFHITEAGETVYEISQKEGILLKYLKAYNPTITEPLKVGTQLLLTLPKEQKTKFVLKK